MEGEEELPLCISLIEGQRPIKNKELLSIFISFTITVKNDNINVMEITKNTVKHVGHLARIELQDKELDTLSLQLKSILDFIDQLKELDTKNVLPTSHILPLNNVLREDECRDSLAAEKALSNAPQKKDSFFVVPKIID